MTLTILFYVFVAIVFIQVLYSLFIFGGFVHAKTTPPQSKRYPISVIVYVKNHQKELPKFLKALSQQSYPNFEIILVNNASHDDSLEICKEFAGLHSQTKIVDVKNNEAFWGNKRYALTLGIKVALHDHLLFTEPDAIPDSAQWIAHTASQATFHKTIVVGYHRIAASKKSIWNKLIRLQHNLTVFYNFAWIQKGKALYATNKNLLYHKELFFEHNGFIDYMNLSHGEDYFFINKISTPKNTTTCGLPTAFTNSPSHDTYTAWKNALHENHDLFKKLPLKDRLKIDLFTWSRFGFYTLALILLILSPQKELILSLVLFRLLIVWVYIHLMCEKHQEKSLSLWLPLLEPIHTISTSTIAIRHTLFRRKN